MGVASARVGQHEQARAVHGGALKPRPDYRPAAARGLRRARRRDLEDAPQRAVHRHPDERDDLRTEPLDFLVENLPSFQVFGRDEVVDARARPGDEVRHSDPPLRQPHIVLVRHRHRHDPRGVEQSPEAVGRPREVVARPGRQDAGIDADEDQAHARLNRVGQSTIGPGGLRIGGHELVIQGRAVELQL